MSVSQSKWGDWVRMRALTLGISTKKEMASICGVNPKVVAAWYETDLPFRMRESSIEAIAKALDTHPQVIKTDYIHYDPQSAPTREEFEEVELFANAPDELLRLARLAGYKELADNLLESKLRGEISSAIEILGLDDLRPVYSLCRNLLAKAMSELPITETATDAMMEESRQRNDAFWKQREALRTQVEKRLRPK